MKKTQNKNLSKAGKPRNRGTCVALLNRVPRINMDKMSQKYKFIQINLHHIKAVNSLLCQKLPTGETDITLIQECWV
jgi:hypothetical protein